MIKIYRLLLLVFILPLIQSESQIKIVELPFPALSEIEVTSSFENEFRQIIPLMNDWLVYVDESKDNATNVNLPCYYEDGNKLIFEKNFEISESFVKNYLFELHCNGVNYSAEILLNDIVIFKDDVAGTSFNLPLAKELLKSSEPNNLKILVTHELDDEKTIPPIQRFLFPKNRGGITKEVFISAIRSSNIFVNELNISNVSRNKADLEYSITLNTPKTDRQDSISTPNYRIELNLFDAGKKLISSKSFEFKNSETNFNGTIQIQNPILWSPSDPNSYDVQITLFNNNLTIDNISKTLPIANFEIENNKFLLNSTEFKIIAVTYTHNNFLESSSDPYKKIENDLQIAKDIGFNTVRFAKIIPDIATLSLCRKIGLVAFVELPIHSLPEIFAMEPSYILQSKNLLKKIANNLLDEPIVGAVGFGTSYIASSTVHQFFIDDLAAYSKTLTNKLTYASFLGNNFTTIENLDLYGIELNRTNFTSPFSSEFDLGGIAKSKVFISESTYPNYYGSQSGYLFKYSLEAQAKYFEDVINYSKEAGLSGFCLNTLKSYSGDYTSMFAGYNENNEYAIGLVDEVNNPSRITYKVISSKLAGTERVTIPIGSVADDSPIFIIFAGLALALLMAVLINSKKKFREDATRALFRPYNFYADIRDQRILSGIHTFMLMVILAGAHALLLTNVLYYLKNNIILERALLSFAQPFLLNSISYLSWNPFQAFIYCYVFSIIGFVVLAIFIKIFSFFIKTRVHFFNTYFVVVWAFLPLVLLLPIKLILYRVLVTDIINLYIYIFLALYLIWIIQRIVKGVYVIFDTSKYTVYFYSIVLLILTLGSTIAVFHFTHSSIYYLLTVYKQYPLF